MKGTLVYKTQVRALNREKRITDYALLVEQALIVCATYLNRIIPLNFNLVRHLVFFSFFSLVFVAALQCQQFRLE